MIKCFAVLLGSTLLAGLALRSELQSQGKEKLDR